MRPFLKWPGGKYRIIPEISKVLPKGRQLVEPFVGGGALFLNTDYEAYLLNDINQDLINLYRILKNEGTPFIDYCHSFFVSKNNSKEKYYDFRVRFNHCQEESERSALFLYLNRHGYNGLCRYNAKGGFNVPFGEYKSPYFPEKEMMAFHQKLKKAQLVCEDFQSVMKGLQKGSIVYCDPPYVPLNKTAYFTSYYLNGFGMAEQKNLALMAHRLSQKGIPVLISNHYNRLTKSLYEGAKLKKLLVSRSISCHAEKRKKAMELLALYE